MSISPILLLIFVVAVIAPIVATNPRKLTDTVTTPGGAMEDQSKCGDCPCNKPCYTSPPPPPSPKKPSPSPSLKSPPPPSYNFIAGPPGNLYPVDPYSYSSADRGVLVASPFMVVVGLAGILAFW